MSVRHEGNGVMSGMERVPRPGQRPGATATCPGHREAGVVRDLHDGVVVRLTETAGRIRAAVSGEIDLVSATTLRHVLEDCLRSAPGALDVDLSGVSFFDCSGLNVLLHIRTRARECAIPLLVTGSPPTVARLLDVAGASDLLTPGPRR